MNLLLAQFSKDFFFKFACICFKGFLFQICLHKFQRISFWICLHKFQRISFWICLHKFQRIFLKNLLLVQASKGVFFEFACWSFKGFFNSNYFLFEFACTSFKGFFIQLIYFLNLPAQVSKNVIAVITCNLGWWNNVYSGSLQFKPDCGPFTVGSL